MSKHTGILGIDASLRGTGLAFISTANPTAAATRKRTTSLVEPKLTGVSRLLSLRRRLEQWLEENDVTAETCKGAIIEDYAFGATGHLAQIGEWGGVLRLVLAARQIPIHQMNVMHLKQFIVGKGNAKKDEVILHMFKRFAAEFGSNDECDAYGLALAGHVELGGDISRISYCQWFSRYPSPSEKLAASKIALQWEPPVPVRRARVGGGR